MSYYSVPYSPERCRTCRKPAKVEVMTSGTMSYGYFCVKCGAERVKAGNEYLEVQRDFARKRQADFENVPTSVDYDNDCAP